MSPSSGSLPQLSLSRRTLFFILKAPKSFHKYWPKHTFQFIMSELCFPSWQEAGLHLSWSVPSTVRVDCEPTNS